MDIGGLNRRVDILQLIEERDKFGGVVGEWRSVARVWAKIEPISGTEYYQAQQVNAETTTRITIRYRAEINVMHRIQYGAKLYEIIGVSDSETGHRMIILNCKEMVNHGLQREAKESKDHRRRRNCPCAGVEVDGGWCGSSDDEGG